MTVAVETPWNSSTGDGSTTSFLLGFTYSDVGEVEVEVLIDGAATVMDYTIIGQSVVFDTAPPVGATVNRRRVTVVDQAQSFPADGRFPSIGFEDQLDRHTRAIQERIADAARTLRIPDLQGMDPLPGAADRALTSTGFDENGAPVVRTSRDEALFLKPEMVALLGPAFKGDPGGNVMAVGPFDTLTAMTIPAGANYIQTSAWATPASGKRGKGGARYVFVPAPITLPAAGQNKWWFADAAGRQFTLDEPFPTVDHFGAAADGVTDDTAAIDAAWAYSRLGASWTPSGGGGNGTILASACMRFGGGSYVYSGAGLNNSTNTSAPVVILGAGRDATRITVTTSVHFCRLQAARSCYVADLEILGGLSAFYFEGTGGLVTNSKTTFERLIFTGYANFAIGSDRSDHPGAQIRECAFSGNPTTGTASAGGNGATFGIAWGGFVDEMSVSDCIFGANAYDIKLGSSATGTSGNWRIEKCGFFGGYWNGSSSNKRANIWIAARIANADNSGAGGIIRSNKFGNEGRTQAGESATPRLLFAAEDTGSSSLATVAPPSTSITSAFIAGVIVAANNFVGVGSESVGIMRAEIAHIAVQFCSDNKISGGAAPYILEFGAAAIAAGLFAHNTAFRAIIDYSASIADQKDATPLRACNTDTMGAIMDLRGDRIDNYKSIMTGSRGAGYKLLYAAHGAAMVTNMTSATATTINDARGAPLAAQITLTAGTGSIASGVLSGYDQSKPLHLEFDVRKSAARGMNFMQTGVDRTTSPYSLGNWAPVALGPDWRTVHRIVDLRILTGQQFGFALAGLAAQWASGTADRFDLGAVRIYQCETQHDGRIIGVMDPADADFTASAGAAPDCIATATALTAGRTGTLSIVNRLAGEEILISRIDAGAFSLTVKNATSGGTTLATLAAGQWARFRFNGTAWVRVASGTV